MPFPYATSLRLDVEDPSLLPAGAVVNRVANPDGSRNGLGGWGWAAPPWTSGADPFRAMIDGSALSGVVVSYYGDSPLNGRQAFTKCGTVAGGETVTAAVDVAKTTDPFTITLQALNSAGAVVQTTNSPSSTASRTITATLPSTARSIVLLVTGDTTSATHTIYYAYLANVRVGVTGSAANVVDRVYRDVLGSATEVTVTRDGLGLGVLEAALYDAALDPAINPLLRPGRQVRLYSLSGAGAKNPIFTGTLTSAPVTYLPRTDSKRAQINLTAVDRVSDLAQAKRPVTYNTPGFHKRIVPNIYDLLPYQTGFTTSYEPESRVMFTNPDATALDQVVLLRDSRPQSYAWVDRTGRFRWTDSLDAASPVNTLTQARYGDNIDVAYDTDEVINTVTVTYLLTNLATGQTVEETHGPFVHQASLDANGPRAVEITAIGSLVQDRASLAAEHARLTFAVAAQPVRRVRSLTLNVAAEANALPGATGYALLDIYDLVNVTTPQGNQSVRVSSLKHMITPTSWTVDLGFARDGGIAPPQPPTPQAAAPTGLGGSLLTLTAASSGATTSLANGAIVHVSAGWVFAVDSGLVDVPTAGSFRFLAGGLYDVNASVTFNINATGRRLVLLYLNDVELRRSESGPGSGTPQVVHKIAAKVGDVLTVRAYQNSGAALALAASPGHDLQIVALAGLAA